MKKRASAGYAHRLIVRVLLAQTGARGLLVQALATAGNHEPVVLLPVTLPLIEQEIAGFRQRTSPRAGKAQHPEAEMSPHRRQGSPFPYRLTA
jgi:hypothetical protein